MNVLTKQEVKLMFRCSWYKPMNDILRVTNLSATPTLLFLIFVISFAEIALSHANSTPLENLSPQIFNLGSPERVARVEYSKVVIDEDKRTARLQFEAAAMKRVRFPGYNGPWVVLRFLDITKKPISPWKQVAIASVTDCGGYQTHKVELHKIFPWTTLEKARAYQLRMPGGLRANNC